MGANSSPLHIIIFPFMSKGHTIPLLHLAKLLHKHRPTATFTIITTTANKPFISNSLSSSLPSNILTIIPLTFPPSPHLPSNIESTDQLPSMSLFPTFATTLDRLQPAFETTLEDQQKQHPNRVTILISDGFLHWTHESSSKFGIPRLAFYGMSSYAQTISRQVTQHGSLRGPQHDDEPIIVPEFPWIKVTRNDFESPFNSRDPKGPAFDFVVKCGISISKSYGMLMNCFYELESKFLDFQNSRHEPKCWPIGPLCLGDEPKREKSMKPIWVEWLDNKLVEGKHVLYIAFGSQSEISNEQLKEIIVGLEDSNVNFLWVVRIKPNQEAMIDGLSEKVKERGLIVKGWVEQREVLEHESVKGFLSHCGWNSITESICSGVPILGWPFLAEQPLNTRMIVEELKIGLRVETCDGSVRGFVRACGLSKMVKELMNGEKGEEATRRVKELKVMANKAIQEGGSSWENMELLLNELENRRIASYDNGNGMMMMSNGNGSTLTPTPNA